ncbi:MAG: serine hydrolase domain-containing protein [Pseudomonadales bacterium]
MMITRRRNVLLYVKAATAGSLLLALSTAANAVNIVEMRKTMQKDLDGTVNGYALVIKKGNATQAWKKGWAIRPVDVAGGRAMTLGTRSFIASVTKTITAVATLQLLEANNLAITEKISNWLPNDWVKGPGIGQLTFRDLMRHKSGFKQIFDGLSEQEQANWGNDWDGLEWIVENGAIPGSTRKYKNANFALLRVIIPKLWKASGASDADFEFISKGNNGYLYVWYVTNYIFNPSGIDVGASCTANTYFQPQAMAYDANDSSEAGSMSETSWPNCGGHVGLRLSARDLVRFLVHLENGTLLSPVWRFVMDYYRLGWRKDSNTNSKGRKGKWWHDGVWNKSSNRGYRACIMKYPGNVVAALVINSRTEGKGACTILKDSYNNAQ